MRAFGVFAALLMIASSPSIAQASDRDCNSILKSGWDSALNDLAALRIDLDGRKSSGVYSPIEHALDVQYHKKFAELLAVSATPISKPELETILKQKILSSLLNTAEVAKSAVQPGTAPSVIRSLTVKSEEYPLDSWSMENGDVMRTDSGEVLLSSVDQIQNQIKVAKLNPKTNTFDVFSTEFKLTTDATVTFFGNDQLLYVANGQSLFQLDWKRRKFLNVVHFEHGLLDLHYSVLKDGRILVTGSTNTVSSSVKGTWYVVYNPADQSITDKRKLWQTRTGYQQVVLDDSSVLVIGGKDDGKDVLEVELIDPVVNNLTHLFELHSGRSGFTATLVPGNKVVLAGGSEWIEVIDINARQSYRIGIRQKALNHSSATLLSNGLVLVSGGVSHLPAAQKTVLMIDADLEEVVEVAQLKDARKWHHQVALSDNEILVVGGAKKLDPLKNAEKITIQKRSSN